MRLHIIARGKIGRSPEAELVDRYLKLLPCPHQHTELLDSVGNTPPVIPNCPTLPLYAKCDKLS